MNLKSNLSTLAVTVNLEYFFPVLKTWDTEEMNYLNTAFLTNDDVSLKEFGYEGVFKIVRSDTTLIETGTILSFELKNVKR